MSYVELEGARHTGNIAHLVTTEDGLASLVACHIISDIIIVFERSCSDS